MNVELLDEVIKKVKSEPESWDQDTWGSKLKCGTTFCLAGHAAIMAGAKPIWYGINLYYVDYKGECRSVSDVGREVLDLDELDAYNLFSASNSIKDIEQARDILASGHHLSHFEE